MRGLVVFLIAVIGILSISLVVANMDFLSIKEKNKKEESQPFEFSSFTSAVCEKNEEVVNCKDEVFINCNGKISKAVDVNDCNGIILSVPKTTGFAVFEKDWKDPRN